MTPLTSLEIFAIKLSLFVSVASVILILPFAILAAWFFSRKEFRGKIFFESLIYFPLVLPPVVTGFLLLLLLNPTTPAGRLFFQLFGRNIAFDVPGAIVAAGVVAFPLVYRPIKAVMEGIDPRFVLVSRSLGRNELHTFVRVIMPMCLPGIIAGAVLGWARSLGEFGATIMLAGSIPFKTTTLPLAVFSTFHQIGGEAATIRLVVISVLVAFAALILTEIVVRKKRVDA